MFVLVTVLPKTAAAYQNQRHEDALTATPYMQSATLVASDYDVYSYYK
jgi:hypothetical protein